MPAPFHQRRKHRALGSTSGHRTQVSINLLIDEFTATSTLAHENGISFNEQVRRIIRKAVAHRLATPPAPAPTKETSP